MSFSTTLSLSFLDLVTCGFGGVTLLFLILLAVQGPLADPTPPEARGAGAAAVTPFVLVVEADPETTGALWLDAGRNPWQFAGARPRDLQTGYGPREAILIGSSPPGPGFAARVGPLAPGARFRVRCVAGGILRDLQQPSVPNPTDPHGWVQVWP